jgi:type IX secretion system PorP/SprF family membrane protein
LCKGRLLSFIFWGFIISSTSRAQVSSPIPDFFDQFINNYYLLNPANTDTSYKVKIRTGDKSQTGLFKGVNKIYFDADFKAKTGRKEAVHFIGIQAINYKEGDFINLSRLFGRYSWRTRISQRSSLSAGISIGFVNYAFKASQASAGGSAAVPDGSAGMWYLREKSAIGFSVQQMFKGRIQPVNQSYELDRNYNLTVYRTFILNPYLNFHTHLFSGFQKNKAANISVATVFEVQEKLDLGITYRHKRALVFMVGLKKINIATSHFSLYFSYLIPTGQIGIKDNALEIYLGFQR